MERPMKRVCSTMLYEVPHMLDLMHSTLWRMIDGYLAFNPFCLSDDSQKDPFP